MSSRPIFQKRLKPRRITVSDTDRSRLGRLLESPECHAWGEKRCLADLEWILEQAQSDDARLVPQTLVTMNTTLTLNDIVTNERRAITLVYPDDVDLVANGVSIFEPLGVALLGCTVGDVIQCPAEDCQRRLRVDRIIRQPEQAGAWHL